MPYVDKNGVTRYSDREQYHHYKGIADSGKAPARTLQDGTVVPAKSLTRTEIVRYANKAESARKRLNDFVRSDKYTGKRTTAPAPVVPAKQTKEKAPAKPKATKKPKA